MSTIDDLEQSLYSLFRLPLELRRDIYKHFLPPKGKTIHISARSETDERLAHVTCAALSSENKEPLVDCDTYHTPSGRTSWGASHQVCFQKFNGIFSANAEYSEMEVAVACNKEWQALMLTCRTVYCEVRNLLYADIFFSLHGDDLATASRFFSIITPGTLQAIRSCNIYWRTQVPMFVRTLASQYYEVDIILPRLVLIESRWKSIAQSLNTLPQSRWTNLQLKGRWDVFQMEFSASPSEVAQELEEETGRIYWWSEYFATTVDFASYKLMIQSSIPRKAFTMVKVRPPDPPLEATVVGSGRNRPWKVSGAAKRFREARKQKEMARRLANGESQS